MKPALLVIDMQKGYFKDDKSEAALPQLIIKINRLIEHFDHNHWPVIHLHTIHQPDKSTWTLSMLAKNRGFMLASSKDTQPVEGLEPSDSHIVISKTRDNAFTRTDLENRLNELVVDQIILTGVSTHECIAVTAMDGYGRDFKVTLSKEGTYSPEPQYSKMILDLLKSEFSQDALSNTAILVRFNPRHNQSA